MKNAQDVLALDDPLRAARAAQRSARYDVALDLLEGCEDWPKSRRKRPRC